MHACRCWPCHALPCPPTNVQQGIPGCLPWGVMQTYLVDYLHLQQGFSVEVATVIILVFGMLAGCLFDAATCSCQACVVLSAATEERGISRAPGRLGQ